MSIRVGRRLVILFIGLFPVAPMIGETQPTYFEDFSASTYEDTTQTTADWNTGDGQLKLFPFAPTPVGSYNTPGTSLGLAVAGDLALVADGPIGALQLIDITDPAAPALLGTYNTPGYTWGVVAAGDLAFVADGPAGLHVLDISDPTAPALLGTYDTPGYAYYVAVSGDLAFVADDTSGLQVIDIGDPTAPTLLGTYDTPGNAWGVAVDGDNVFVADYTFGLQVVDITDPTAPVLVGTVDTPGHARGVAVEGDLAFVADGVEGGLQVVDITDPSAPAIIGFYNTVGIAYQVAVEGNRAFIADYYGPKVIDITNPANPVLVFAYDTPGSAWEVAVAGPLVLVADGPSGLQLVNVSHALIPAPAGSYVSNAEDVVVRGDVAYVPTGKGLEILNVADPDSPMQIGSWGGSPDVTEANHIAVAGNLAAIGYHTHMSIGGFDFDYDHVALLDISDPTNPAILSSSLYQAADLALAGDHLIAATDTALVVLDISDPATPGFVGSLPTNPASDIVLAGDLAFLAGVSGWQVVDISEPASPTSVAFYGYASGVNGITVAGDLAFVAAGAIGVRIDDITDFTLVPILATLNTPGIAEAVAVAGDLVFVADGPAGLQVFDITDPTAPVKVGSYDTPGYAKDVTLSGNLAFVADEAGGVQILYVHQDLHGPGNTGQSLAVNDLQQSITRSRITTTEAPGFSWEISADAGAHWQAITPGLPWQTMGFPGADLRWRAIYIYAGPDLNPVVDDLSIEWLYEAPAILSISDVPNDQGRQVRLEWRRSSHDFLGDPSQVVEYTIYRRIDPNPVSSGESLRPSSRRAVRQQAQTMQSAGWDYVMTVPVRAEDDYAVVVPTLADSTAGSPYATTFMVSGVTATVGVFFDSAPDSGYSVDNLAPGVPQGFAAALVADGVHLTWEPAPEEDFRTFRIYRSTDPGFEPGPETLVHETASTSWQDSPVDPGSAIYKITARDTGGNESAPASSGAVTGVDEGKTISPVFGLLGAMPNPLHTSTRIAFELAEEVSVTLDMFDVSGRLVRTLVRGRLPAGTHEATWDGSDSTGRSVPAGVYLYRLRAGTFHASRRLVVIR